MHPPDRLMPHVIEALKAYQTPELDGFFMAKLDVTKPVGPPALTGMEWRTFPGGQRGAIIVHPFGDNTVTVVLLQPGEKAVSPPVRPPATSEPEWPLRFTRERVAQFVRETGDDNASHQGANPVVPGLLLLLETEAILAKNGRTLPQFRVKFLEPVRVNQPVRLRTVGLNRWVARHETGSDAFYLTILED